MLASQVTGMPLPSLREVLALLGPLTLCSCSFAFDLSADQCGNDADCASFGERYSCIEGICVGDSKAECEQASDCPNFENPPQACLEAEPGNPGSRQCVELRTPECPIILPTGGGSEELWREALASPNPIVVGGFAEVEADGISTYSAAYDLAFSELQEKRGGVPGANGALRPVIAVVCNNGLEAEGISAGMSHLVNDLLVPGVVSGLRSDQLRGAFSDARASETNPNVLFMSPGEADQTVAGIQDDDLIWTLLPSAEEVAVAYEPLLTRAIEYQIERGRIPEDTTIKLMIISAPDLPLLDELTVAVKEILVFNGKSYAENEADGNAQVVTVVSSYQNPNADLSADIDDIMEFAPHVIVALGADELFSDIVPAMEERWMAEAPTGQARPYFLLSPYHFQSPSLGLEFVATYRTPDPFELRAAGVQYASAPEEYQPILTAYEDRFFDRFPDDARRGYENFYDAPWWLIYSIVGGAGAASRFDGRDLVDGLDRLQDGTPYAMGPDDVNEAFNELFNDANSTIQLNGTLGPPTFDNTGTRQSPGSVWCIASDGTQILDVMRVDESSGEPVLVRDSNGGFAQCHPGYMPPF